MAWNCGCAARKAKLLKWLGAKPRETSEINDDSYSLAGDQQGSFQNSYRWAPSGRFFGGDRRALARRMQMSLAPYTVAFLSKKQNWLVADESFGGNYYQYVKNAGAPQAANMWNNSTTVGQPFPNALDWAVPAGGELQRRLYSALRHSWEEAAGWQE